MWKAKEFPAICLILVFSGTVFGADVILNEYNAVSSSEFLNGGNAAADDDGGRASDSYFGRVLGNGGDWFELVVITDHLDMRNWRLDIYAGGSFDSTLQLTNHSIWSDLRGGTIITVSEDLESDISYNPAAGDWWINVQANNNASGLYIGVSNFPVSNDDWQLRIRNAGGAVIFGPAGEGVIPDGPGVSNIEIFLLEANPSAAITPTSNDYDDSKKLSTFGAPNRWGLQNFNQLRSVAAEPSTITLLSPNGLEIIMGSTTQTITWENQGTIDSVLIEFSVDNGDTWTEVYPPNVGNTGSYDWLVPIVDSEQCRVRITNTANLAVYDSSNAAFSIYECQLAGDMTGDCVIDMNDFAVMALNWLQEANPYE